MSKQELVLEAQSRDVQGKGAMRKLRGQGQVPGVIYGLHEPVSIQVAEGAAVKLVKALHGKTQLLKLKLSGAKGKAEDRMVLMKEVQRTAVGQRLIHIDFNEIDVKKPVRVGVDVHAVGTAVGVTFGGIQQLVMHKVQVECLPTQIPAYLEIDVTPLKIGHSFHVKDIPLPAGVKAITDGGTAVVVISGRGKDEDEGTPGPAAVAPAAPEAKA